MKNSAEPDVCHVRIYSDALCLSRLPASYRYFRNLQPPLASSSITNFNTDF